MVLKRKEKKRKNAFPQKGKNQQQTKNIKEKAYLCPIDHILIPMPATLN